MRILATLVLAAAMAGSGCSHHKSTPAASPSHFSSVPGMEAAPAPSGTATPSAGLQVIPFGAPAVPTQNSAGPGSAAAAPTLPGSAPSSGKLIVTPEQGFVGKIATVNDAARFVIVTFPVGHVPPVDQPLVVYRNGLKVGELKVTEPQRDEFTAADIVTGDTAVGDEVRDK